MSIITTVIDKFNYQKGVKRLRSEIEYEVMLHDRNVKLAELTAELEDAKKGVFKQKVDDDGKEVTKKPKKGMSFVEAIHKVGDLANTYNKRMPNYTPESMALGIDKNRKPKTNEMDLNLNKVFQPEHLFNNDMFNNDMFDMGNGGMFGVDIKKEPKRNKKSK